MKKRNKILIIVLSAITAVVLLVGVCSYTCMNCIVDTVKNMQVVLEDTDTGKAYPITRGGMNSFPRFSHDGKILYFLAQPPGHKGPAMLGIFSLEKNKMAGPVHIADAYITSHVAPDGRVLCYSKKDDHGDLYLYTIKGAVSARITKDGLRKKNAALSPDGRFVAYQEHDEKNDNIFLVPVSGGTKRKLTDIDGMLNRPNLFTWTADSRRIAYISFVSLIVRDLAGAVTDEFDLAGLTNFKSLFPDPKDPDGFIVCARNADGGLHFSLFKISRKDRTLRKWKDQRLFWEMNHTMSPDGKHLAYMVPVEEGKGGRGSR